MARISIIVGSVYGGARLVAEELQSAFESDAHVVTIMDQPSGNDIDKSEIDLLLVCTSTTGAGDLPDELVQLHADLRDAPPNIVGLDYAVIALGDSSYGETFCGGGKQLDAALLDIGANQISEPLLVDAMETEIAEEVAVPWATELVAAHFKNLRG